MTATATPPLDPGLVYVEGSDRGAIHRLVLGSDHNGETLWVDAGGAASTYGLTAEAPNRRALRGIRVARAFTAHQHHQLVRNAIGASLRRAPARSAHGDAVEAASGRTGLLVAPNVAALYEKADASDAEIDRLFDASLGLLCELGDALDVPVLVSAPYANDERRAAIRERASTEVECRRTDLGYAFATEEFQTTGYWQEGWWQTTIPYWVELFGAVGSNPAAELVEPTPAEAATVE